MKIMDSDKLNIDISYPQQIEIKIEFLVEVLGNYKGLDNLDETWDDNIMPIINESINESGAYIKKSKLEIIEISNKEKFSYALSLFVNPPFFNLSNIKDNLKKNNLQSSLRISRIHENGNIEELFSDIYYMDKQY
ncbi:hypothetical protein QFZ37_001977 [Chryseobacterium ginsenosidimutans]|uniref:hypothetical protein n=1 Tax=Chryseobacterium ginsenosidimutans TaxID=687846 RepID=UPI002784A0B4|nr:hypothetical protein [Chryseobacterium ginsenosidimutans]MDQ0593608.1 hypothetical protein [Chryseobacterium ginsenosidimutans]